MLVIFVESRQNRGATFMLRKLIFFNMNVEPRHSSKSTLSGQNNRFYSTPTGRGIGREARKIAVRD